MTQYNTLSVKLSNSHFTNLKSGIKSGIVHINRCGGFPN